MLVGGVI
jgi:hypothetical protein